MLKDLYELQKIDLAKKAVEVARRESAAYRRMKELKADFAEKKADFLRSEEELAAHNEQLNAFPAQIQEAQKRLDDENTALYSGTVGSVKELNARENQINSLKDKLEELQALEKLYQGEKEAKKAALEAIRLEMARDYHGVQSAKAEYEEIQAQGEVEIARLDQQREALAASLSAEELKWYDSVKHKNGGSPIARLNHEQVCCGCFTIVTPVAYQRACRGQEIYCEKCGRVLFVDDAGTVAD